MTVPNYDLGFQSNLLLQWKRSVQDIDGEVLCSKLRYLTLHYNWLQITLIPVQVSQFTLLGSTKKGSKPDFHRSAGSDKAKVLYEHFVKKVKEGYNAEKVKDGVFQAMMEVSLINDGPVRSRKQTIDCMLMR